MTWQECEDLFALRPEPPVGAWFFDPFTSLDLDTWKRFGSMGRKTYEYDDRLVLRKDGGMENGGLWRVDPRGGPHAFRISFRMNMVNPYMLFTLEFYSNEAALAITWNPPTKIYIDGSGPCSMITVREYFDTDIIWTLVCFGTEISLFQDGVLLCGVHTLPPSIVFGNMRLNVETGSGPGRIRISDFAIEDIGDHKFEEWKELGAVHDHPSYDLA